MSKKILVALSGGVDSAVSALLLKKKGHLLTGANMRFWEYKQSTSSCNTPLNKKSSCCSPEDLSDAEKIAKQLEIPFYALKMEANFREKVIEPFISDYQNTKTPNPCVHCNTFIKFGEFYEQANYLNFDHIATGHYASTIKLKNNRYAISRAKDSHKDQSYYLYGLSQDAIKKTIFPLSNINKEDVREIALKNEIPIAQKPDSQEICFIPENNYRNFLLQQGVKFQSGFIKNTNGEIIGKHSGKENFTIGQRKGLNIQNKNSQGKPLYVIAIHKNGDVIVGYKEALLKNSFYCKNPIFQGISKSEIPTEAEGLKAYIQIRYNSQPVKGIVFLNNDTLKIELLEPTSAITPGQAVVCYDIQNEYILLGGKISLN